MTRFQPWKSGAAALMAMTITTGAIAPVFVNPNPASAQSIFGQPRTVSIRAGATLPLTYEKDKIVVAPGEKTDLTLTVANNLIDSNRNVLIPEGTEVIGQLQPFTINNKKGVRFVAQKLRFADGREQFINATSRPVTRTETIRKGADTSSILTDAAIGAGAASVIALITGDRRIQTLEPLGGAAAGAVASLLLRRKSAEVIVIDPQRDLNVTLNSNLVISRN
jgi:hypothetical protein